MPRNKRYRLIQSPPLMTGYRPFGIPIDQVDYVVLHFDEYESIRLCDYEGRNHEEAATLMAISRPTLTRIYESARQKVAQSFIEGKALLFDGGMAAFDDWWAKCNTCNRVYTIEKPSAGICPACGSTDFKIINEETTMCDNHHHHHNHDHQHDHHHECNGNCNCVCVHCDLTIPHQKGIPCREERCPECGRAMLRENSPHHKEALKKLAAKTQKTENQPAE